MIQKHLFSVLAFVFLISKFVFSLLDCAPSNHLTNIVMAILFCTEYFINSEKFIILSVANNKTHEVPDPLHAWSSSRPRTILIV